MGKRGAFFQVGGCEERRGETETMLGFVHSGRCPSVEVGGILSHRENVSRNSSCSSMGKTVETKKVGRTLYRIESRFQRLVY